MHEADMYEREGIRPVHYLERIYYQPKTFILLPLRIQISITHLYRFPNRFLFFFWEGRGELTRLQPNLLRNQRSPFLHIPHGLET